MDMDPEQGAQQRDSLVEAMLGPLYEQMLPQVRQILEQGRDAPERAIGRVLAQLMLTAWQALTDQGKTVAPGVLVQAGMVAAQAVGEIAVRLGVLPEQGNGDAIEAAFMLAMGQFGQAAGGDMPPEQRQRYAELIGALRQAKQLSGAQPSGSAPQQPQQPQQPQGGM
ncbi:hypothetical protein HPA02_27090 [Bisbaumannia pacifica]|uniref:Uncharacterized protein n=1 Tax=Bisbaumannia pacifica TaxID=77098 RepID=A0A510XAG1_9GAMM|nr:hypothetical protein [Halomonas pacifica]GEK48426.1 hypothetical protein HPA02_27090 [Halomonas pacifica]